MISSRQLEIRHAIAWLLVRPDGAVYIGPASDLSTEGECAQSLILLA